MRILVVHAQGVFPGHQGLLCITCLRQRLVFQRTQGRDGHMLRVDQVRRRVHEAVGDALQRAKVGQIEGERSMQLVAVGLFKPSRIAREGGLDLLIGRTHVHRGGSATRRISRLHRRLDQRFGERTGRTGHRGSVARRDRERARTRTHGALRDPASQTAQLASRTQRTCIERLVLDKGHFGVALQFLDALDLLISHFRLTPCLVDHLFGVSDDEVLVADLGVVAPADGRRDGQEGRDIVTFDLGVVGSGSQRISLPFVETSLSLGLSRAGLERGIGRRNVVDNVRQVFTLADGGVGRVGVGDNSHG